MDTHIVIFDGPAAKAALQHALRDVLARLQDTGVRHVRFAIDHGHLKIKVGEGMWSRPYGAREREFSD